MLKHSLPRKQARAVKRWTTYMFIARLLSEKINWMFFTTAGIPVYNRSQWLARVTKRMAGNQTV
jgi:hypothetical protein